MIKRNLTILPQFNDTNSQSKTPSSWVTILLSNAKRSLVIHYPISMPSSICNLTKQSWLKANVVWTEGTVTNCESLRPGLFWIYIYIYIYGVCVLCVLCVFAFQFIISSRIKYSWMTYFLMQQRVLYISQNRYHGSWWFGGVRGQSISSHDIDLVCPK